MKVRLLSLFLIFLLVLAPVALADEHDTTTDAADTEDTDTAETDEAETETDSEEVSETDESDEAETEEEESDEAETDEEEVDEETEEEVAVMHSDHGRHVRLLQLHFAIQKIIFRAELVIDYLQEQEVDTAELEAIIEELEALKEEIRSIPESETHEEAVEKFVEIKKNARRLVNEFKEIVKGLTDEDDRDEIRDRLEAAREEHQDRLEELREEIRDRARNHRSERVEALLERFDIDDEELVEQIRNGEITVEELKQRLRQHWDERTDAAKDRIKNRIQEERDDLRMKRDQAVDRIRDKATDLQQRGLERAGDRLHDAADRIEQRRIARTQLNSDATTDAA